MTAVSEAQAALAAAVALRDVLMGDSAVTYNQVERTLADVREQLDDAIDELRSEHGVDSAAACAQLVLVGDRLTILAEQVAAALRRLVPYTLDREMSHTEIAFILYQDVERGLEIVELNAGLISNPNRIPQGTELRVLDQ